MKIVTKVGAVAVLGCVLSGAINGPTAVAQATAAPSTEAMKTPGDAQLLADVLKALDNKRFANVKVGVENGLVTLTGTVEIYSAKAAGYVCEIFISFSLVVSRLNPKLVTLRPQSLAVEHRGATRIDEDTVHDGLILRLLRIRWDKRRGGRCILWLCAFDRLDLLYQRRQRSSRGVVRAASPHTSSSATRISSFY